MVDETVVQDNWGDGDMADPQPLPEKTQFIGYVSSVSEDWAEAGEGKTFRDGRSKVRQIVLTFNALGVLGQGKFNADVNYYTQAKKKFWVGDVNFDVDSRRYLRRVIENGTGLSKEEIGSKGMLASAKLLEKTYFTYEITNKESEKGGVFSTPVKIKAATIAEVTQVS